MEVDQIISILRLFNAYVSSEFRGGDGIYDCVYGATSSVGRGIIYTTDVNALIKTSAESIYGLNAEELNQTFHKSFKTIEDTPLEKLVAQQILHYFTTYGMESLNIYSEEFVYLPKEKLEIPNLESDVKLKVIRDISKQELREKLQSMIESGIALSEQTVQDIINLSEYIDKNRLDKIKNREVKIALYDKFNKVPSDAEEFIRYIVYKLTSSTLYIKNNAMINALKSVKRDKVCDYFYDYLSDNYNYVKLAEIFLRNKNIFLAFKTKNPKSYNEKMLNNIINRISKLAKKHHKPLEVNVLDRLTSINNYADLIAQKSIILQELNRISIFREIRILNALLYASSDKNIGEQAVVYKIRNGKVWATTQTKYKEQIVANREVAEIVKTHLIERLKPRFENKTIYIPENVIYTAPTSEKQFVSNMPEGSSIEIAYDTNMVIGVHWCNLDKQRVDLDLKLLNLTEQFGWNASYRSNTNDIYFSGDVTDAPKSKGGATELFLIKPIKDAYECKSFLLKLNDYTQCEENVPFEFIVAELGEDEFCENYTINPNKVKLIINSKFDKTLDKKVSSLTLGFVDIIKDKIRVTFRNGIDAPKRVSSIDNINKYIYEYTENTNKTQITLAELLKECGAKLTSSPVEDTFESVGEDGLFKKITKSVDYDLSLDKLNKNTIIDMFGGI